MKQIKFKPAERTPNIFGKTSFKFMGLHDKEVMNKVQKDFKDEYKEKNPTHRKWERVKSAQEVIDES